MPREHFEACAGQPCGDEPTADDLDLLHLVAIDWIGEFGILAQALNDPYFELVRTTLRDCEFGLLAPADTLAESSLRGRGHLRDLRREPFNSLFERRQLPRFEEKVLDLLLVRRVLHFDRCLHDCFPFTRASFARALSQAPTLMNLRLQEFSLIVGGSSSGRSRSLVLIVRSERPSSAASPRIVRQGERPSPSVWETAPTDAAAGDSGGA